MSESHISELPAQHTGALLKFTGKRGPLCSYPMYSAFSEELQWVSLLDPTQIRIPRETTTIYPYPGPFAAGGKEYQRLDELTHSDKLRFEAPGFISVTWGNHYKDIHGRDVFQLREPFPCFDGYDCASENRFYNWYFLFDQGKLIRIQYTDTSDKLYVTEDVAYLETHHANTLAAIAFQ